MMWFSPGKVGVQLGAVMVLALLPLGLLSVSQTRDITRQAEEMSLNSVLGATREAAAPEIDLIRGARAATRVLASIILPYTADPEGCRRVIGAVARSRPEAVLVAFVPVSGQVTCTNAGAGSDVTGSAAFRRLIADQTAQMIALPRGSISNTSVLNFSHPVFDEEGRYQGFASISVPHHALETREQAGGLPVELLTFQADGEVLTASNGLDQVETVLPVSRTLEQLAGLGAHAFVGRSGAGEDRIFAVVPIEGDLNLLGSWPVDGADAIISPEYGAFLVPALMWFAGLAVALLASERLVGRHLRRLSGAMRVFAAGERSRPPLRLDRPPDELAALAETYRMMTETILRDEAELENLLREKQDLLREVHHRTGNSLQLIASILRMHLREDPDAAVRRLLEHLHDRVMSLSTVHFGLYRLAGSTEIEVAALLGDVIGKLATLHGGSTPRDCIRSDLAPVTLPVQQAVPLALLVSEILPCFMTAAMSSGSISPGAPAKGLAPRSWMPGSSTAAPSAPPPQPIIVRLRHKDDERVELAVAGPAAARAALTGQGEGVPEIISGRLIRAFVSQLGGTINVTGDADDAPVTAQITFQPRFSHETAVLSRVEAAPGTAPGSGP